MSGREIGTCNTCGEPVWIDRDHACSVPRLRAEVRSLREELDRALAERDEARVEVEKLRAQILADGLCSVCQGHGTMGTGNPSPEGGEEIGPCGACDGSGAASVEAARERASRERAEEALRGAEYAMRYSASALHNGGGTGHEEVRLIEAADRARAVLSGLGAGRGGGET